MYWWIGKLYDKEGVAIDGLRKDDSKALMYYLKEANMVKNDDGYDLEPIDPDLYIRLGLLYQDGRGTSIDHDKAIEYYKKASDTSSVALAQLGMIYDIAYNKVPYHLKDDTEARRYYEAAFNNNPPNGEFLKYLGNMYRDGRGGDMEGEKAMMCYDKAIDLGYYDAQYEKGVIFDPERNECPPFKKDGAKAAELYLKAAGSRCVVKGIASTSC